MLTRPAALLRNRNFLLLTLAGSMSQLGDRITHMLIITVIGLAAPGRLLAYSGGAFVFVLPTLILSPVAGVVADHWNRRKIISRTHFIQFALIALTPLAIHLTGSYWPFWVALVIFFGLDTFNNTATPALMPALVEPDQFLAANSLNLTFARVATVIGMVAGGFLISSLQRWFGPAAAWRLGLWIDSAFHLAAGGLALAIVLPRGVRLEPIPHHNGIATEIARSLRIFFADLAELLRLVFRDRLVAFVLLTVVVSTFVSAVAYTLLIFLVQQVLGLGTGGVGVFSGILAVGMIAGALSLSFMPPRIDRPRLAVLSVLVFGLLFLTGGRLITLWFLAVVALVAGIAFSWLGVLQNTMLQEEVPPAVRGRIFSTREFVANVTFLVTTLLIGTLGDLTSYRLVLTAVGAGLTLTATAAFFWIRKIRSGPPRP
uniref:MFS transporter n=1 Tax=candidate division WOR-3 bacterium TaxID=2052148 RepID=A0A7C4CCP8_UNCW3